MTKKDDKKKKADAKAKKAKATKSNYGTVTKISLLRAAFAKKKVWTRDDLCKATGYDNRNVHTALAILRNPNRTKPDHMLVTEVDRAESVYKLVK